MLKIPRRLAALSLTIALAATLTAAPAVAGGGDGPGGSPAYVIVGPDDAVQVGSATFYPTGPIDDDTLVVILDDHGNLPGGISVAQLDRIVAARAAGDEAALNREMKSLESPITPMVVGIQWGAPIGMVWGATAKGRTGLAGTTDSVRVRYTFGVTPSTNQQAVGRGIGYYMGYNGSEFGKWRAWYGLGAAATASKDGTGTVPWGNTLAVSEFQGKSIIATAVAQGQYAAVLT